VTAAPPRPRPASRPAPVPPAAPSERAADPALQQRRRLRLAAALAAARLRLAVLPASAIARRQRVQLCSAARILTAAGVRVRVVQPGTPWPRHRPLRLVTGTDPGWLGDLAVLTAVPRTTGGWSLVADRALPAATSAPATASPDAALCPVVLRFRDGDRPLPAVPRRLADVLATRRPVLEVELLPALTPPATGAA
jgi:hypothetical protein